MKKYDKVLVGSFDKHNNCNANSDEILIVIPTANKQNNEKRYYFVSVNNRKLKSEYGWVKDVDTFSISEFCIKHNIQETAENVRYLEIMFDSISTLSVNTPCAVEFKYKTFNSKEMILHIHKVIFYKKS